MKICAVYGTERRGCTWHIAQEVLSRLPEAEVTEFFLPRDCPDGEILEVGAASRRWGTHIA